MSLTGTSLPIAALDTDCATSGGEATMARTNIQRADRFLMVDLRMWGADMGIALLSFKAESNRAARRNCKRLTNLRSHTTSGNPIAASRPGHRVTRRRYIIAFSPSLINASRARPVVPKSKPATGEEVVSRPLAYRGEGIYLHIGYRERAMSRPNDLLQGTLDLLVLKMLAFESMNGWSISQRLKDLSSDILQVSDGSLYPALHKLEQQGWIEAEWRQSPSNRRAKFYSL